MTPTLSQKAEWTAAYINNLPDSSFAVIEGGGKKDSDGKTVPRSLRHFPHHNAEGGIDLPHLRNALARAPQSPFGDRALPHLRRHARSEGVGQEAAGFDHNHDDLDFGSLTFSDQAKYLAELIDEFGASVSSLAATLEAEQHALTDSKRQDLEALLETFPSLDTMRADIARLLQPPPDEPSESAALALRLRLKQARHRLRASGLEV